MDRTLYNASGCKDKTAHDAICSASKPQTQVFRSDWTRRDNEADMFVKMVKRLAKGFNFKLCDRIRFEDPESIKRGYDPECWNSLTAHYYRSPVDWENYRVPGQMNIEDFLDMGGGDNGDKKDMP